jgi:exosortase F-associated protein
MHTMIYKLTSSNMKNLKKYGYCFLLITVFSCQNDSEVETVFYLRRFLIQPLFLLLFIPAFYLQKKQH